MKSRFTTLAATALAALCAMAIATAEAAPKPGCAYEPIDLERYGGAKFAAPDEVRSRNGMLALTLTIDYSTQKIAGCETRLRTYNGKLVGPTLRVKPGDTMRIRLDNRLPPNPPRRGHDPNTPHDFNTTNLHTHGLWVSPLGNGDNVTLRIEPGTRFDYEIAIPADHPPGTFWYHAHVHGSTALQVSSGMAGLIIIEGGLDEARHIAGVTQRLMVFQQISYNQQGVIENYDGFGPNTWGPSHRQTTINGQIVPTIGMKGGEVQRWRMVHGGVRETISPTIRRFEAAADYADQEALYRALGALTPEQVSALPRAIPLHEIAADGLAFGRVDSWDVIELQPGYRSDVMVKAPAVARRTTYLLTDNALPGEEGLLGEPETERILARIVVEPGDAGDQLPTTRDVAPYLAHQPIDRLDGEPQSVVFNLANRQCDVTGKCSPRNCNPETDPNCSFRFMISDRTYSTLYSRAPKLGTAAEWTLSSMAANHPFHIHVNPFQVTRVGPDGRNQIVWKDTLFVRQGAAPVKVRTRYERYIGTFVIHCHILDHEDQGMMELVTIVN